MNFIAEKLEDDLAWKAIHKSVKVKKYIPSRKLEKIMEEDVWRE